jgi:EAL domain-containing protein (putative c-di-GMP-specific phosphodiesterase class I)
VVEGEAGGALMDQIGPVRKNELALVYQPQMSSDGATMVCVEALVRHDHPERGRLGAGELLRNFDTTALLEDLDWWVLERACKDALQWPSVQVSVNISATQFHRPGFADRVLSVVERIGLPPSRLELEIVEAAFINDYDAASINLNALRDRGVKIALDDFGTGYSSLTYLLRIPVDKVKIDKCFIDNVEMVQSAAVVHAIVSLARAVGLKVTAEGVETAAQHRFLKAAGCHYMQGYLFSMALSVDGVTRMIEDQQLRQAGSLAMLNARLKAG